MRFSRLLVTGGAGFIGSTFVRRVRRSRPDGLVVNLDALTYAANPHTIDDLRADGGHVFVRGDICDAELVRGLLASHQIEAVVNFAAESHVDRSILSADSFVETNVVGTVRLLDAARAAGVKRFLQVSTDEVYGSLGATGLFREDTPLSPRSPYSASKAAADQFVQAYHHTHGMDVVITRCSNNYGPYQFPEKLIPLMTLNALQGRPLPVYGDGQQVRDWIHVEDHCAGVELVLGEGAPGEVYNVPGEEHENLEVTERIIELTAADRSLIRHVEDRPGHDRRYALDGSKLRGLGWQPKQNFVEGLAATVTWYRENRAWWEAIKAGEYREYYERQYGARLA